MSIQTKAAFAVACSAVLAACGGGGSGNSTTAVPPNSYSLGTNGTITEARADISRGDDGRIILSMTEGPMAGTTILCVDQTMGRCQVVGGPEGTSAEGTLVQRLAGNYAFVGNFAILQLENGGLVSNNQLFYGSLPEHSDQNVALPQGNANYTGEFEGGFGLANGESGLMSGSASLVADFNSGRISGAFSGATDAGTGVTASFNNVTINATNGQFASTDDTVILFQGVEAGGDVHGAFYGPNAEEAAGMFHFGNDEGGMSGLFLACQGNTAGCIE
jgi:hypothetical protein